MPDLVSEHRLRHPIQDFPQAGGFIHTDTSVMGKDPCTASPASTDPAFIDLSPSFNFTSEESYFFCL